MPLSSQAALTSSFGPGGAFALSATVLALAAEVQQLKQTAEVRFNSEKLEKNCAFLIVVEERLAAQRGAEDGSCAAVAVVQRTGQRGGGCRRCGGECRLEMLRVR